MTMKNGLNSLTSKLNGRFFKNICVRQQTFSEQLKKCPVYGGWKDRILCPSLLTIPAYLQDEFCDILNTVNSLLFPNLYSFTIHNYLQYLQLKSDLK
jgi:hypothetical protein